MTRDYYIKCAPIYDELVVAAKYSNKIELQLLDAYDGTAAQQAFYLNLIKTIPAEVLAVHTPLRKSTGGDTDLSYLHLPQVAYDFNRTCELASELASLYRKKVLVICHYGGAAESDPNLSLILRTLSDALHRYPDIKIGVENVVPLVKNGTQWAGRPGTLDEVPRLLHLFWQEYGQTPRLGSVLDTCHAMVTQRFMRLCGGMEYDLTWYFCLFQDTLIHLHVANARDLGYGPGEHGCVFDVTRDAATLQEFASGYHRYGNGATMAIEVWEPNYLSRPHYQQTKEAVEVYLKEGIHS